MGNLDILLAGHSHTIALGAPRKLEGPPELRQVDHGASFWTIVESNSGGGRSPEYWAAVADHSKNRIIVIAWAGGQCEALFLLAPTPMFDFVLTASSNEQIWSGVRLIPKALLKELF